jgi:membrane protein
MSRLKKVWNLFFETGKSWGKDHAGFLAAGLSYFTVFSIAPLLLLAIALAGKLFGPAAAEGLVAEQLGGLVGPKVGEGIQSILSNAQKSGAGAASIMGGILLLFAASRLFTQLRIALNMIWNVAPKKEKLTFRRSVWRLLHKRLLAFAMVLCVGACLALFFLVDAGLGVIWNIFGERLLPEFLGVHFLKVLNLGVSLIPLTFLTAHS